ncbi:MAG: ribosome maturation factor RimM [Vulcanococcus sp.]
MRQPSATPDQPTPRSSQAPAPGVRAAQAATAATAIPAELLEVGRLVAAQGLRGEVRLLPMSDFPERFTRPGPRWLRSRQGEVQAVRLLSGRQLPGKELYVLHLEGCDDRSSAEALVGHHLLVDADDRPPLEAGEFHLLDLVGLQVRLLPDPEPIGTVTDLIHGGNDLLEIAMLSDGRRLLIPFVEAIVPEVHPEQGWIGLTPPPGLLEL